MSAEVAPVASLVGERMGQTLVPGGLWQIVKPLLWPRTERPQGGGTGTSMSERCSPRSSTS